jgi:large subunit ribosomal protein L37Ae
MATKKVGSTGRFGSRYGLKIRKKILNVEKTLKSKHKCQTCARNTVKRVASGIWYCKKCDRKFTGKAYSPA